MTRWGGTHALSSVAGRSSALGQPNAEPAEPRRWLSYVPHLNIDQRPARGREAKRPPSGAGRALPVLCAGATLARHKGQAIAYAGTLFSISPYRLEPRTHMERACWLKALELLASLLLSSMQRRSSQP